MNQNLKPFDLEKALSGDPVVTRDGTKVVFIAFDKDARIACQLVIRLETDTASDFYYANGVYVEDEEWPCDLFMAPKTKKVWIVLVKAEDGMIYPLYHVYHEQPIASDLESLIDVVKVIETEIEE